MNVGDWITVALGTGNFLACVFYWRALQLGPAVAYFGFTIGSAGLLIMSLASKPGG